MSRQTMLMTTLTMIWMTSVSGSFPAPSEVNTCDISEFRCPSKDGQGTLCLPMDRWCNGKDDCDNRVDEPRSCSSEYLFFYSLFSFLGRRTKRPNKSSVFVRLAWAFIAMKGPFVSQMVTRVNTRRSQLSRTHGPGSKEPCKRLRNLSLLLTAQLSGQPREKFHGPLNKTDTKQ